MNEDNKCPCGCENDEESHEDVQAEPNKIVWNEDPKWISYTYKFEQLIQAISAKYTCDEHLREDCQQEARIALLTIFPSQVRAYAAYSNGDIPKKQWENHLDSYCRNVIRNSILSYLDSLKTGCWYIGRTRRVISKVTGEREKVHLLPRYSSFNQLQEEHGLDIDTEGELSWPKVNHISLTEGGGFQNSGLNWSVSKD